MTDYSNLFSTIPIGPRTSKNRVWMTAHSTQLVKDHNFADEPSTTTRSEPVAGSA
jgi:2,4-dienoyl-CoA reductase-like NADH-dependent reductase (Old Yellow Enzyme family)